MPRGTKSQIGDTRVQPNGYHNTRTENGWRLTHRILVEKSLDRPLREGERVRFIDGDRTNLNPENLEVYQALEASKAKRRATLEARIDDLQAQLEELE